VTSLRTALIAMVLLPAALAFAAVEVPDCVETEKHSNADGTGAYRHAVEVRNGCDEPIECTASSDSAPDPITFSVDGGSTVTKVLKIGSPHYVFELRLRCEKQ